MNGWVLCRYQASVETGSCQLLDRIGRIGRSIGRGEHEVYLPRGCKRTDKLPGNSSQAVASIEVAYPSDSKLVGAGGNGVHPIILLQKTAISADT